MIMKSNTKQLKPYYVRLTDLTEQHLLGELQSHINIKIMDEKKYPLAKYLHYNIPTEEFILFNSFAKGFNKIQVSFTEYIETLENI